MIIKIVFMKARNSSNVSITNVLEFKSLVVSFRRY